MRTITKIVIFPFMKLLWLITIIFYILILGIGSAAQWLEDQYNKVK